MSRKINFYALNKIFMETKKIAKIAKLNLRRDSIIIYNLIIYHPVEKKLNLLISEEFLIFPPKRTQFKFSNDWFRYARFAPLSPPLFARRTFRKQKKKKKNLTTKRMNQNSMAMTMDDDSITMAVEIWQSKALR